MPNTYNTASYPHLSGIAAHLRRGKEMLRDYMARRALYRQACDELHALTNRELADLGIHRSEIPRIAREAAQAS